MYILLYTRIVKFRDLQVLCMLGFVLKYYYSGCHCVSVYIVSKNSLNSVAVRCNPSCVFIFYSVPCSL